MFGFIRVKAGGRWAGTNRPNRYRLTWIGWVDGDGFAQNPTNEWKGVTADFIAAWRAERKAIRHSGPNVDYAVVSGPRTARC